MNSCEPATSPCVLKHIETEHRVRSFVSRPAQIAPGSSSRDEAKSRCLIARASPRLLYIAANTLEAKQSNRSVQDVTEKSEPLSNPLPRFTTWYNNHSV